MRTYGLGGDSEVALDADGTLSLGPRRVMPLSLLASTYPEVVLKVLEHQLSNDISGDFDGRFVVTLGPVSKDRLDDMEQAVLRELERGPRAPH